MFPIKFVIRGKRHWATRYYRTLLIATCLLSVLSACGYFRGGSDAPEQISKAPAPTITAEPILPTRTLLPEREYGNTHAGEQAAPVVPAIAKTAAPSPFPSPTSTSEPSPTVGSSGEAVALATPIADLARFGIGVARSRSDAEDAYAAGLMFGSALDWNPREKTQESPFEFWEMVRLDDDGIRKIDWYGLARVIESKPNAYWLIGNEPDVQWQDNVTPERYAEIYHDVYTFIKERDPGAAIAIGGVSQPTPLRRAYLDIVLDTYEATYGEPMPIDIWNVHAFILREEAESWGVGIPPGMEGQEGILYEIEDHDNIEIFTQNLLDFRKWMVERGYGDKPLVISEYGILMPADYGFPVEDVSAFMEATFDFFREAAGEDGYAKDDGRLFQWWFWYSVYDDLLYPTGNLWDAELGQLTELGDAWSAYVSENGIAP